MELSKGEQRELGCMESATLQAFPGRIIDTSILKSTIDLYHTISEKEKDSAPSVIKETFQLHISSYRNIN